MTDLSLEDIEFIKILANSDSTTLQAGMNEATRYRLDAQIGVILREYYKENTMNTKSGWIEKFEKHNFKPYDCLRELIWNNEKVSPWYRQNVLFFVNDSVKNKHPSITINTKKILPLVHPEIYRSRVRDAAYSKRVLKNPYTAMRYFASNFFNKKK